MDKRILIAGCGHGGLVAAYNLAKQGYSVTVYEKALRRDMGHDWKDTMVKADFAACGLPVPDDNNFAEYEQAVFNSPYSDIAVGQPGIVRPSIVYVDRIWLINYLIDACLDAGVDIRFGSAVKKAITVGRKVVGVVLEDGEEVRAPLVIDACGMYSPLRRSLPVDCGIQRNIPDEETFFVYRAYFDKLSDTGDTAKYNIWFFHCEKKGLDWVILEDDAVDLLVGGFGGLTDIDIDIALDDFRRKFPFIGEKIVRGGQVKTIPVRKALSQIICDGYALVGDSASMVEPLSGSGISLSFRAGKILADTVAEAGTDAYTMPVLWKYQYEYFRTNGNKQIKPNVIKGMLTSMTGDDIDYLFAMRFLTEKELGGSGEKLTAKDIFDKVVSVTLRPSVVPALITAARKLSSISRACELLPEKYNIVKIRKWQSVYDKF